MDWRKLGEDILVSFLLALGFASGILGAAQVGNYFSNPDNIPLSTLIIGVSMIVIGIGIIGGISSEVFEG